MRNRVLFISVAVFIAVISRTVWAIEPATPGNPTGFSALRPGGVGSGLIRSPNPIDTSGNLVITGNVSGGRHFRDVVPYGAITDFGAVTGSSSLDSFLRRSASSEDFGRFAATYRPFFSPSSTVTTLSPGQVRVSRPPTMVLGGAAPTSEVTGARLYSSNQQFLPYGGLDLSGGQLRDLRFASFQTGRGVLWIPSISPDIRINRPLSMTLQEVERAILAEVGMPIYQNINRMPGRQEAATGQDAVAQQFPPGEGVPEEQQAGLERGLMGEGYESSHLKTGEVLERDALRPVGLRGLSSLEGKQRDAKSDARLDVYEHMDQQIAELQKSYEQLIAAEIAKRALNSTEGVGESSYLVASRKVTPEPSEAVGREKISSEDSPGSAYAKGDVARLGSSDVGTIRSDLEGLASVASGRLARSTVRVSDAIRAFDKADVSARAKAILGPHRDALAFWDTKFNQHMATAEKYLEEGRFYRSADAYTLALVYKSAEPLAYMGKSHAFLAAGEYMSSALFLSRAVTTASEGSDEKDGGIQQLLAASSRLLAFIDKDTLESRLVDVEQWQQRSGSVELQFLLGYIYYQMGRLEAAREVIDDAYDKMPEASAVVALRRIIDSKWSPH
jgi:tetratricopeptide (TPR) repeat protein